MCSGILILWESPDKRKVASDIVGHRNNNCAQCPGLVCRWYSKLLRPKNHIPRFIFIAGGHVSAAVIFQVTFVIQAVLPAVIADFKTKKFEFFSITLLIFKYGTKQIHSTRDKSLKEAINSKGPKLEPCATPLSI